MYEVVWPKHPKRKGHKPQKKELRKIVEAAHIWMRSGSVASIASHVIPVPHRSWNVSCLRVLSFANSSARFTPAHFR